MTEDTRIRILIADDDHSFLKAVSAYLQLAGREIRLAHDGRQAVDLLDEASPPYDIVITDLVMPEADGLVVLQKALARNPQALVILMTGFGSIDIAIRAIQEGAFDYKTKPLLLEEMGFVLERAEQHLRLRRERDRLLQEREDLFERFTHLEQEVERLRKELEDNEVPVSQIQILRNRLDPQSATLSYRQWQQDSPAEDEFDLLDRLRERGAITPVQFDRLRKRISSGS
jgi:DNA-binding NtrC family response regulator